MLESGVTLLTKDGHLSGNCTIIDCTNNVYRLITDAGNIMKLTISEILSNFYIADYPVVKPKDKIERLIIKLVKQLKLL